MERLNNGTYFYLITQPDNSYDKDAISIVLDNEKIGYVAKADQMAFVMHLKLKRKVYGMIIDIQIDSYSSRNDNEM